ncbi:MAG: DUF4230 domain-containing protein [Clostridia bacterium]|nr:DUF4230 domain-containing protein [Clostridia bacterium]
MENIKSNSFPSIKTIPKVFWPIISILITISVIIITALYIIPAYIHAKETGEIIGSNTGKIVGKALGSYDGITSGLEDGYEAGKIDGLSAEDTEVKIANAIAQGGKLEVLSAKVKFEDFMEYGKKYAAIYMLRGNISFTIDLTKATLSAGPDGKIVVMLPMPEAKVTIDDEETSTIAEWQRSFFNGSSEDGFDAYLNSKTQIKEKAITQVNNYEYLLEQAKESAKSQAESISFNICGYTPTVVFKEG